MPCNVVAVVHGEDPFLSRPAIVRVAKAILRGALPSMEKIVVVGSRLQTHVQDLGVPADQLSIVANGVSVPCQFSRPVSHGLAEQDGLGSRKIILSVSNLITLKGIDDNLSALAMLKERDGLTDWEYRIVGEGPDRPRLETLAASLGIEDHVVFLGRLSRADTFEELRRCHLFSLPSWNEAFGIVYLEAMAIGRPVVGCHENGPADFVSSGENGLLVPPRDVTALALAIRKLWDSPGEVEEISKRGHATAEEFSWDRNVERMLDALKVKE